MSYIVGGEKRKKFERNMFAYLKKSLKSDPVIFKKKYVIRNYYGEEARRLFPYYLGFYSRLTGLAGFEMTEAFNKRKLVEDVFYVGLDIGFLPPGEVYNVVILDPGKIPWYKPKERGKVSFKASEIEELNRTEQKFTLKTERFTIDFASDSVLVVGET
jgi:hypothetical protein